MSLLPLLTEKKKKFNLNAEVEYYVLFSGETEELVWDTAFQMILLKRSAPKRQWRSQDIWSFCIKNQVVGTLKRLLFCFYFIFGHIAWHVDSSSPTRNLST